jgi:hypothetical protein
MLPGTNLVFVLGAQGKGQRQAARPGWRACFRHSETP